MDKDSMVDLDAAGGIVIEVKKKVEIKDRVQMVLLGDGQARDVLFLVGEDVKLGKRGNFAGTFLAPYGNVELNDDEAKLYGALYGKQVNIRKRSKIYSAAAVDPAIRSLA